MTAYELLINTAAFYGADTTRRSTDKHGNCVYDDGNGNNCAIGRWLTEKPDRDRNTASVPYVSDLLPEALKKIDTDSLCSIQGFHDNHDNWYGKHEQNRGLTPDGQVHFKELCLMFRRQDEKS